MRGSRRRAVVSMEKPKVAAPRQASTMAQNHAPSEILAATPLAP
jgi:hypothetical protein